MASWENGQDERDAGGYSYSEEAYEQPYSPTGPSSINFIYDQDPRLGMAAQAHQLAQLAAGYDPRSRHLHLHDQPQAQNQPYLPPQSQQGFFSSYPTRPPPALMYARPAFYPQSEPFGVPSVGSSSQTQQHLHPQQHSWSASNHYQPLQHPPPALAYGYYNHPPPHSANPPAGYSFPSPQSSTSSSFTTRPRTYTNSSSGSGSTDGTNASSYFEHGQHSALGDGQGGWEGEALPLQGQKEDVAQDERDEPFAEGASQGDRASMEPTSPFTSHAADEARSGFLLEGEHDALDCLTQDERFFFEPSQELGAEAGAGGGVEADGVGDGVAEDELLDGVGESESDQLRFAEQLFGMRMYGARASGGAGYSGLLSSSPQPLDLGDGHSPQLHAEASQPSPHNYYSSSSSFNFNPQYPSARAIASDSTTPRYHSPAVSPAHNRSPTKVSSLTSLSSSSQSSTPARGGSAPSGSSQLESVSAPRAVSTSPSSLFGPFQQSCRVFDDQGSDFALQPEISPPAFTYDSKLSAWLGYRRNYLSLSAFIALPAPSSSLYLHSSTTSATKISHFLATTIALTLPTHLSVPLLQLDTTRKLERATPLAPSRFELPSSYIKADNGGKATAAFTRVQFRNSTANHPSGASSVDGMTTRFCMRLLVEAVMAEGGRKVEVGRWESGELVIRGRSPTNFGIVTAKGREMTAAAAAKAKAGVKGAPKQGKSKTKAKARTSGKGKKSEVRDYSSSEDEMDDEDVFLASFAQSVQRRERGPPLDDGAGPSTSTALDDSTTKGKRGITWDDYDSETLNVAKRTRSARR